MARGIEFSKIVFRTGYSWLVDTVIGKVAIFVGVLAFFGVSVAVPLLTDAPSWLAVPTGLVIAMIVLGMGAYRAWDAEDLHRRQAEARRDEALKVAGRLENLVVGWVQNPAATPAASAHSARSPLSMQGVISDLHLQGNGVGAIFEGNIDGSKIDLRAINNGTGVIFRDGTSGSSPTDEAQSPQQ